MNCAIFEDRGDPMMGLRTLKNEKGALSIEFLGILPFYFIFFLLLWQVVASGYAVMSLKSAANDGASVYAMTGDAVEAQSAVMQSIGGSALLASPNVSINPQGNGAFTLTISAQHPLVFIPAEWKKETAVSLNSKAAGKVFVP
ncbi:pilus assembly protein [Paenisporosarcina sp. FSL H8-0542]|uniref:pilus assembly protein n=2 Tax=unclassified Paenisporosarcina TaxID=2642018 RepID=UPI00315A9D05